MLTEQQIQFCKKVIELDNYTDAYQEVFKCKRQSARAGAVRFRKNIEISKYINQLRNEHEKNNTIATLEEMKIALSRIIRSEESKPSDIVNACRLLGMNEGLTQEKKVSEDIIIDLTRDREHEED